MMSAHLADASKTVAQQGRWLRRLRPLIAVACGLAFITDLQYSDTLAVGVIYLPMICMALLNRSARGIWLLAGAAIFMVVIGTFIPDINPNVRDLIGNRILSVLAILLTAALVSYACSMQELLMEQTRRAEDAERLKTELLTNLGSDLRAPLHGIIGLTTLMSADCQPHHREPLRQVQTASRRLLTTTTNLVDLAKVEQPSLPTDEIDLRGILHRAVEAIGPLAADRQIAVVADGSDSVERFAGNSWAVRRILENLLDSAVASSSPGGVVRASITSGSNGIAVAVAGDGFEESAQALSVPSQPAADASGKTEAQPAGGIGFTLSRRLAELIGAELSIRSEPRHGTTTVVRFPIAA